MPERLTSPPGTEPVTLAEAKSHLRLDDALDDADVSRLIQAAREYVEEACWRGLITQSWELVRPTFAGDDTLELGSRGISYGEPNPFTFTRPRQGTGQLPWIELPRGQLQSVTSVKYIDGAGVQQTLAVTEYSVDTVNVPGRIRVEYGKTWPITRSQWDAVRIVYVVGWANAAAVPSALKQAMLILIATMYEYRTDEISERVLSKVGFSVSSLLATHRLSRVG